MYKIMIADDEGIVIEALKFIIEKNFGDSCTIVSAKTGRSVIELSERFNPDIAFMDINMPGINGIDAIKEIRKNNKQTIFIVISAYDKFDYAKEAISLGVWSYINKPIEQKLIVSTLKEVMAKVDIERDKRKNDLIIKEKLEIVIPIIESDFIYSILLQESFSDDMEKFRKLLGIEEEHGYIVTIKFGEELKLGQLENTVSTSVQIRENFSDIKETIKNYIPNAVIGALMANMITVFVPYNLTLESEYDQRVKIINNIQMMICKINDKGYARFISGIGSVKKINKAIESYKEAVSSLRFYKASVTHVKDLPTNCEYEEDYPLETEKALFRAVTFGDIKGAEEEATYFFDWMINKHSSEVEDIKLKTIEFILYAEHLLYKSGGLTYKFNARSSYIKTIVEINDLDKLKEWFILKIKDVCYGFISKKENVTVNLVSEAKEYILEHYAKDISLDIISRKINVSPYYFSKLFKEETGENFIEYVTNIRIEKAKELLKTTGKSIKDICTEVGYSDPNYFSRSFKRNVGLTPTEFKEVQ